MAMRRIVVIGVFAGILAACNKTPAVIRRVPVARVHVVALSMGSIKVRLRAYGFTLGAPGDLWNVVRPYDTEIRRVYAVVGQRVQKGQVLLKIGPGPSATLQDAQLLNATRAAQAELASVTRRYRLQLATRTELLRAQQRLNDLDIRLRVLHQGVELVRAPAAGIISRLPFAASGIIVPAGQALATLTAGRALEARLGIEPDAARALAPGASVSVRTLSGNGAAITGHIAAVSGSVGPNTGLVSVFVALPPDAPLLVGQYVRAVLTVATGQGFVVPRSAVLPVGAEHVLYTIRNGRAVQQQVRVVLANRHSYEIADRDLETGEPVVILGNYELRPGMKVQLAP